MYLVKRLNLKFKNMDQRNNVRRGKPTADVTEKSFQNLTKTQIFSLFKLFQPDFELFDYSIEPYFSRGREDYSVEDISILHQ